MNRTKFTDQKFGIQNWFFRKNMCWVAPIDDGCYMLVCTTI